MQKTVLYLGFNGFPYGLASGERQMLISKGLVENGFKVTIISRKGIHDKRKVNLPFKGIIEGIEYVYTSGTAYKPKNFIVRSLFKVIGVPSEFFYIIRLRLKGPLHYAIIYTRDLLLLKYYYVLSKIFGFKVIVDYTELGSSWNIRQDFFEKFESNSPNYLNGAICISDYLVNQVYQKNPSLPIIKIPAICDLEKIEKIIPEKIDSSKYFLFCGTLFYLEVIEFILDSFVRCETTGIFLYLIVNGSDQQHAKLRAILEKYPKKENVKIFSDLKYSELISLYKNALALLIPLRPTLQDIARFPHKIGEYTSTGKPIITTNVGEISNYFINMQDALICEGYDSNEFSQKMKFVMDNNFEAKEIGEKGKIIAIQNFDYHVIGEKLTEFLTNKIR